MKINEQKLKEYIRLEDIQEYNSEKEFLVDVNNERKEFWKDEHPNEFLKFEDVLTFAGEYALKYKDKYYWIFYDHCLDIYKS